MQMKIGVFEKTIRNSQRALAEHLLLNFDCEPQENEVSGFDASGEDVDDKEGGEVEPVAVQKEPLPPHLHRGVR